MVSRNRLFLDGKVTGLIKDGERESGGHRLLLSPFILPSLSSRSLSLLDVTAGQDSRANMQPAHGDQHKSFSFEQNFIESRFRSIRLKSDRERKKESVFFLLCNDNDIINMNNAMSAMTFFPFFNIQVIFTRLQKHNVLSLY